MACWDGGTIPLLRHDQRFSGKLLEQYGDGTGDNDVVVEPKRLWTACIQLLKQQPWLDIPTAHPFGAFGAEDILGSALCPVADPGRRIRYGQMQ